MDSSTNNEIKNESRQGVRKILLAGIFKRIVIIEAILLVWSLIYRVLTNYQGPIDLLGYALRIIILIAIIILFLMITLRSFLNKKIIRPLEAIDKANREQDRDHPEVNGIELPEDTPDEIRKIVESRAAMLDDIIAVSKKRLHLMQFIRDTFGRYLSQNVVDEILESPEGRKIGGRRETVTILMSDLRGFTSLSENRDPEEMMQLLNRYLACMSKVILKYDGTIDEFIGDGILAVFGVPEKRDDDPRRAVACALEMQNELMVLNESITAEGFPPLEMGVGLNTGSVIVGNIGSEMRMKYGITGSTVNIASRIESFTTGGQVYISESTYTDVKALATVSPPLTAMMKGLTKPLVIYPVSAIGAPYEVTLNTPLTGTDSIKINLGFHCWKISAKKIEKRAISGETVTLNDKMITAFTDAPLEPLTDIKLMFDFCTEAHCFSDIYAKVTAAEPRANGTLNEFRITSINPQDREILAEWIKAASAST